MSKTLKDCCHFQEGYVNPSQTIREYFGNEIKWLRAVDLNNDEVFDTSEKLSIKGYQSAGASAFMFPKNSLAISKSGSIGTLGILRDKMCGNRAVINIDVQENADLDYIFYLLKYKHKEVVSKAVGSIQKNLYVSALQTIELCHDEVLDQRRIVRILKALDEKRRNNNSIRSDLEAMAKLLYDYWFVQFDFPDENGKPYKSSGGKMVWNEELKREIPEGWEVKTISELAFYSGDRISASLLSRSNYIGIDNLLPEMKGRNESEYTPDAGYAVGFKKGDILLGNIRPYFKKIWLSDIQGGCSADVLAIRSFTGNHTEFLFASMARDDFFSYDMAGSKGSKMPRGDKNHIMRYPIVYSENYVNRFCAAVQDWYKMIAETYYENQQLSSLRDFLLPMLMNGQVKIGD